MTTGRRAFLAGVGVAVSGLAGCVGRDGDAHAGGPIAAVRAVVDSLGGGPVDVPTGSLSTRTDAADGVASYFVRYSPREATVRLSTWKLSGRSERTRLLVTLSTYPTPGEGSVDDLVRLTGDDGVRQLASATSTPLSADDADADDSDADATDAVTADGNALDVTVRLGVETAPSTPLFLQAFLVSGGESASASASMSTATANATTTATATSAEKLCETDPFVVADGELRRYDHPTLPSRETLRKEQYERVDAEGCFLLGFDGETAGRSWHVRFLTYKSAYVREATARRKQRRDYVTDALADGTAEAFATILDGEAEANGFTDAGEKVAFLIDFVQALPYVPDSVGTGYDDYTKHIVETLVDGGGDCEDTAIMLASLLEADPFGYDAVLLLLPGHMAVGVYATDLPGAYYEYHGRRYYYLETTGEGWAVGAVPEEFSDASATVYSV